MERGKHQIARSPRLRWPPAGDAAMTKRKPITERMKIDALLHLISGNYGTDNFTVPATGKYQLCTEVVTENFRSNSTAFVTFFICAVCFNPIRPGDEIDWDHGVPDGLGGAHDYRNIRPLHRACHRKKTFGTKATTAGSDIHMIAKAKRIAAGGKKRRGPKMKSAGFRKDIRRKMDGTVTFIDLRTNKRVAIKAGGKGA